jgi:ribosomal protection tetracycline resistance protein
MSGTLRIREPVAYGPGTEGTVTAIGVFHHGSVERRSAVVAGEIAKLQGLGGIRIGDRVGGAPTGGAAHHFAPPTLETVLVPAGRATGARCTPPSPSWPSRTP